MVFRTDGVLAQMPIFLLPIAGKRGVLMYRYDDPGTTQLSLVVELDSLELKGSVNWDDLNCPISLLHMTTTKL